MLRFLKTIGIVMMVSGCASTPEKNVEAPPARPHLNYDEIQNRLGVDLAPGQTGYREKTFDACDLGEALDELRPAVKDCRQVYFALIHFQVSCRPTEQPEGTLNAWDLTPLRNRRLKWNVGDVKGESITDERGAGVIRVITQKSQKRSYLRLSTGVDFLIMRANEATEVVTPPSWCNN